MVQVSMVTSESQKEFVDKLQKAVDDGWKPVWESFNASVVWPKLRGVSGTRLSYTILLQR